MVEDFSTMDTNIPCIECMASASKGLPLAVQKYMQLKPSACERETIKNDYLDDFCCFSFDAMLFAIIREQTNNRDNGKLKTAKFPLHFFSHSICFNYILTNKSLFVKNAYGTLHPVGYLNVFVNRRTNNTVELIYRHTRL